MSYVYMDTNWSVLSVSFFRGIRYLSKYCQQRYAMIGDFLSKEEHDIVLLQEVVDSQLIRYQTSNLVFF